MSKVKYSFYCMLHPFDGFYEAQHRGRGAVWLSCLFMALYGISCCIEQQYRGFVVNGAHISRINSLTTFISSITIFLLFCVANWTITTLFDGKGKLKDIFMVTSYSLVPVVIIKLLITFISNYIILEEAAIINAVVSLSWVWFAFLMLAGLCTIHEYSVAKNLVTLLCTLASAAIIIFVMVLFISLIEQFISVFGTFFKELARRI